MSMMEKAAYIKGLADGMELKAETKEDKMIIALLSLVEEMAETIDEMKGKMSDLEDYVEELDEDLGEVEEILLEEIGDEDEERDGDCENCCLDCDLDDEDEEYDDEYFEGVCPACGDVINFDSTIDPENLACPNCGEKFECIVEEEDLKALEE